MRIKQDRSRKSGYSGSLNCQDFPVKILQLPTAADVAAKYATLTGLALADLTRWRKEYGMHLDMNFLDNVINELAAFAAYLADVQEAIR